MPDKAVDSFNGFFISLKLTKLIEKGTPGKYTKLEVLFTKP